MRAPTSMAVMSTTSPPSHTAIFEVPPPISTFITRALSRIERAAAPEPKAASVASSASPALTATNLPACAGEQIADGAGVAPAHGDAGEDQRARVDRIGIEAGEPVLLGR